MIERRHERVGLAIMIAAALLSTGPAARAAAIETKGATPCSFSAWSSDKDPAGLNVRAAPRAGASVTAKLPPPKKEASDDYAVEFRVIGSRDGCLLIENAKFIDYDGGGADTKVFAGPGWVSGAEVGFTINDPRVFAAPDAGSTVKARLEDHKADGVSGPDSASVDRVFACKGDFADVEVHMPKGKKVRGWVTHLCSNQVTTCV